MTGILGPWGRRAKRAGTATSATATSPPAPSAPRTPGGVGFGFGPGFRGTRLGFSTGAGSAVLPAGAVVDTVLVAAAASLMVTDHTAPRETRREEPPAGLYSTP